MTLHCAQRARDNCAMQIREAAEALNVSYWTILRRAIAKTIPAKKILGRWVVSAAWVRKQREELRKLEQG